MAKVAQKISYWIFTGQQDLLYKHVHQNTHCLIVLLERPHLSFKKVVQKITIEIGKHGPDNNTHSKLLLSKITDSKHHQTSPTWLLETSNLDPRIANHKCWEHLSSSQSWNWIGVQNFRKFGHNQPPTHFRKGNCRSPIKSNNWSQPTFLDKKCSKRCLTLNVGSKERVRKPKSASKTPKVVQSSSVFAIAMLELPSTYIRNLSTVCILGAL